MKNSYSSVASFKRSCHLRGHSPKISSHNSSIHHGGSHVSYHGGSHLALNEGFHKNHIGGSNFSHHGGSLNIHYGGSYMMHHGSSPNIHHGGSYKMHHGSSYNTHHKGSHVLHYGSSPKIHHKGSLLFHHGSSPKLHHESLKVSHNDGHHKAPNKHGGSSCKSVSFSKHTSSSHGCGVGKIYGSTSQGSHSSNFGSHSGWKNNGLLNINEKETMQILNDRLSSYLDKVRLLEQENAQLEKKICEWYAKNAPSSLPDSSQYFRTITDLQNQISTATTENARIILQIDNARLAIDDFRSKYEMELRSRETVEGDLINLRRILEGLNRDGCELGMQVQNFQEELQEMKKNHEEEVSRLRAQLGARVNVEVNAAPSIDLNKALSEIRQQYENLMEQNMREAENMFLTRSEELNRQVESGSIQMQSVQTDLIDLKRSVQTLEIELQSQLSMTSALETTLAETQATYGSQLAQLQNLINNVEGQLAKIKSDLERQNQEYRLLMDQKTHLEMEIATYKRLLEAHDIPASGHNMTSSGTHGSSSCAVHHSTETVNETQKC